jgi:hypothetical protein
VHWRIVVRRNQPFVCGSVTSNTAMIMHYGFDPAISFPGKTVLACYCGADYDYWNELYGARERYSTEKTAGAGRRRRHGPALSGSRGEDRGHGCRNFSFTAPVNELSISDNTSMSTEYMNVVFDILDLFSFKHNVLISHR